MKLGEILTYFKRPRAFPLRPYIPLSPEERRRFREIMGDPVFKRVIDNAYTKKPTTAISDNSGMLGVTQIKPEHALNRLHQLQGWEMLEAAIFIQAEEPIKKERKQVEETYPDAGNTIGE